MALTESDFTPQEIQVLKGLKQKGLSSGQAFRVFSAARERAAKITQEKAVSVNPEENTAAAGPKIPSQEPQEFGPAIPTAQEEQAAQPLQGPVQAEATDDVSLQIKSGQEQTLRQQEEAKERSAELAKELGFVGEGKPAPFADVPIVGDITEATFSGIEGVAKGVGDLALTAGELAGTGLEKITGTESDFKKAISLAKEQLSEDEGGLIEEGSRFLTKALIGGGLGASTAKGLVGNLVAKAGLQGGAISTGTGLAAGSLGGTTGAIGATEERLPTVSELTAGAVIDGLTVGLSRLVKPERLISKAMGLSPTQKKNLSKVASRAKKNGKAFYTDIDDFALKNNITGSREDMVTRARELFDDANASKKELLKGVKTKTKNTYKKFFQTLIADYSQPGNEDIVKELTRLSKKKTLTAVQLERARKLASDALPSKAFSGAEPARVLGRQKLLKPIMDRLEVLDKTGEIAKANVHKSLLQELSSTGQSLTASLEQSAKRSVAGQALFRGTTAAGSSALASSIPGVGQIVAPVAATAGALDAITQIPQVASILAKANKTGALDAAIENASPALKAFIARTGIFNTEESRQ